MDNGAVIPGKADIRPCERCKHHRYVKPRFMQRLAGVMLLEADRHRCQKSGLDPVTGAAYMGFCYIERGTGGACGPSGFKWEPKKGGRR